ncbi:hypothetical protein FRX31_020067 [Thalictrum thalictroides]|uniref:Ty3 transposon capsid-like protein domain-containing protein n=1 Tax=Thalictrum thalictroides TaxID=46969 RepID=A0A7J6W0S7_THATH|nr:hypothetical protein FRX31_020067 [Thalictrum thalictroides]
MKNLEVRFGDMEAKHVKLQGDVDEIKVSMKELTDRFDIIAKGVETLLGLKELESNKGEIAGTSTSMKSSSLANVGSVAGHGILGPPPNASVLNGEGMAARYFLFNPIAKSQMVLFASLHLEGRAETWFHSTYDEYDKIQWLDFIEAIRSRFSTEAQEIIIGDFNKLEQISTVADYQNRFEELKALVLLKNKHLKEEYFVDSFISGLKDEIKHQVQMFHPKEMHVAISVARL